MILWLLNLSLIFVLSAFKKQIQMKGIAHCAMHSICDLTLKVSVECFLYITQMMLVRIDDTDWAADTWILGSISLCSQLIVSFKTYHQVRILTNTLQILKNANTKRTNKIQILTDTWILGSISLCSQPTGTTWNWWCCIWKVLNIEIKTICQTYELFHCHVYLLGQLSIWLMISFPCSYNAIQQLRNKRNIQTKKTSGIKSNIW